jgi:hypothetical protein
MGKCFGLGRNECASCLFTNKFEKLNKIVTHQGLPEQHVPMPPALHPPYGTGCTAPVIDFYQPWS